MTYHTHTQFNTILQSLKIILLLNYTIFLPMLWNFPHVFFLKHTFELSCLVYFCTSFRVQLRHYLQWEDFSALHFSIQVFVYYHSSMFPCQIIFHCIYQHWFIILSLLVSKLHEGKDCIYFLYHFISSF